MKQPYNYSSVIFPRFETDVEYFWYASNEDTQGTNFYATGKPSQNNQYGISTIFNKLELNFNNCIFLDTAYFERYNWEKSVMFKNCEFNNGITLPKSYKNDVSFLECNFYNCSIDLKHANFKSDNEDSTVNLIIHECENIGNLNLEEATITGKAKIQSSTITGETNFYNTKFMDLADFYDTTFNKVVFTKTDFNDIVIFSETVFNQVVNFKYTKFLNKVIFTETVFKESLDLRNTIFGGEASFLDITSKKGTTNYIRVENRETARIIKKSLDSAGNIIEANTFYALEMKKRADELKFNEKPLEWMVFKIHRLSSNHSQSWFLALLWLILLSTISVKGFNIILNEDLLVLTITFPLIIYLSIYIGYSVLETILLYFTSILFFVQMLL